jgi:hypothetical protein
MSSINQKIKEKKYYGTSLSDSIYNDSINECSRVTPNKIIKNSLKLPFLKGEIVNPSKENLKKYDGYFTSCIRGPSNKNGRNIQGYEQIDGSGYAKAIRKSDYGENIFVNMFENKEPQKIEGCILPNDWRYAYLKDWNSDIWGATGPKKTNIEDTDIYNYIPKQRLECCLEKEGGTETQMEKCPPDYCIDSNKCSGPDSDPLKWCTNKLDENTVNNIDETNYNYANNLLNESNCLKWKNSKNENRIYYGTKLGPFYEKISKLLNTDTDENNIEKYLNILNTEGAQEYVKTLKSTDTFNKNMGNFCNNKGEVKPFNFTENNYDKLNNKYSKFCNCYWSQDLKESPTYLYDKKIKQLKDLNFSDELNQVFQYASDVETKGNNRCWFQPCIDSNKTSLIPNEPDPRCPTVNTALCGSQLDFTNKGTINTNELKLVSKCVADIKENINPYVDEEEIKSCEGGNAPLYGITNNNVIQFANACNEYRSNIMDNKDDILGCKFCNKDRTCRTINENNKEEICEEKIINCNLTGLEKKENLEEICNNNECDFCKDIDNFIDSEKFTNIKNRTCNNKSSNKEILESICNYLDIKKYNSCEWCNDIDKYININDENDKKKPSKKKSFIEKYWLIGLIVIFVIILIIGTIGIFVINN